MLVKRFQNHVAESRHALPVMAVFAAGVWLLAGLVPQGWYAQFATLALSTYLMVELNTTNALLHMYSRMVSCSFLAQTSMAVFLFPSMETAFSILGVITFCTIIFYSYSDNRSPGLAFYAFLCLGVSSVLFVHILFFVPFLWIMMATLLKSFSLKMWWASLLGLVTPYWFLLALAGYHHRLDVFVGHFEQLGVFGEVCDFTALNPLELATIGFIVAMALISIIYYLLKNRPERIRTRMIYRFFITFDLLILAFLILQPQHAFPLAGMLMVCTSPLTAQFFTHTHTWLSNAFFCLTLVVIVVLTALNLWMPSFPS